MSSAIIANPVNVVLAEARRYLSVREHPVGSNREPRIDYWLIETGVGIGLPWCAAYISQVGRQALGAAWPIKRSASVQAIYEAHLPIVREYPAVGDLFVLYYPSLSRHAHIGFVGPGGTQEQIRTIEGNTGNAGEREGYGVFERTRKVTPHVKFIRWVEAL